MNKKVYLQPQVIIISTVVESSLLGNSTETESNVGETVKGPEGGGTGGAGNLNSKEHWGSIDEWDSWE